MSQVSTFPAVLLLLLTACSAEPSNFSGPGIPDAALLAKGSGGQTVYAYTLSGDVVTAPSSVAPRKSAPTTAPFRNLSISGVSVLLSAPTGSVASCNTGNATYSADFGLNQGPVWTGTLSIPNTGTLSFLGSDGAGAQIQFSVSDATGGPVQSPGPTSGSYSYLYTDARLFFGSNSTHFDGLYRCVNIAVTATP